MGPRPRPPIRLPLRFVRHGATEANLAGLRCGGDLDLPLTIVGRWQAVEAARRIVRLEPKIGLIVTSDLQRTRETAALIAAALPGTPMAIEPDLAERFLGEWNMRPVDETQPWLLAGCTPPGGESDLEFLERISRGLRRIKDCLGQRPLLVGSKGVARALGELTGQPRSTDIGNGEVTEFELASLPFLETTWGAP